MKSLINLFVFLSFSCVLSAQTNISGGIYTNTTWTKVNSPHIIDGNVVVFDGATLTIEPGATVKFKKDAKITFRGSLTAIGTVRDSITFTSAEATPARGDYAGLATDVSTPGKDKFALEYVIVEYAQDFFDFGWSATNGPYTIKNSRFSNNKYILKDLSASARSIIITFLNCLFINNHYGIYGGGEDHDVYIKNCWFVNNEIGSEGGYVDGCVYTGNTVKGAYLYHEIRNSYLFDNSIGAQVDMHHDTKFVNNQVYNNDIGVVIDRMFSPTPGVEFKNNKICNNTTWNVRYDYIYNIDLTNNCWCSNDSSFIASKIRDGYDDVNYALVKFDYDATCTTSNPPPATISEVAGTKNVIVSPNPARQFIDVTLPDGKIYNIAVINIQGKEITSVTGQSGKVRIPLSNTEPGMYFLKTTTTEGALPIKKLLVQ